MDDRTIPARPAEDVPDALLLAALRRACLHRPRPGAGAPLRALLEHLAIPRRSAGVRAVRAGLERLEAGGLLSRTREHGLEVWSLEPAGEERIATVLGGAERPVLPESPQHAAWRRARTSAEKELERFGEALRVSLHECEELLRHAEQHRNAAPPSDVWFQTGVRLHGDCRRLGSALHCLREWREPGEDRPDFDDLGAPGDDRLERAELLRMRALRSGRRNVALWEQWR